MDAKSLAGAAWKKIRESHESDVAKGKARREREAERKSTKVEAKSERKSSRKTTKATKRTEQKRVGWATSLQKFSGDEDLEARLKEEERAEILHEFASAYVQAGYQLLHSTNTTASLVLRAGDPIGTGGTVAAVATLGLSLATAPARRGRDNDKSVMLRVYENGAVEQVDGPFKSLNYSRVPKKSE